MVSLPRPGAATYMDDSGFEGDLVIDAMSDAIEALSTPLTINGNLDHFEQLAGATQTSTTTYNTLTSFDADQMFVLPGGASVTQARSTSVPDTKSQFSLLVTGAASVTTVDIGQRIEAAIINTRGKQSQVFSAYVYNGTGSSFTPNLRVGTPGAVDDFTTVTNRLDQVLQACANAVWTRVYYVFDPTGYTNVANGLEVALRVPTGVLVATKTANIAQFDVRPGGSLVAYVPPDPIRELQLCRRYFQVYGSGVVNEELGTGQAISTSAALQMLPLRVRMRAAPTGSVSAASHFGMTTAAGSTTAAASFTFTAATPDGITPLPAGGSGLVAGNGCNLVVVNASGRLYVNARL